MTEINDNKLQCKDCVFCTEQDIEHHEGLCTEKHSPKNALKLVKNSSQKLVSRILGNHSQRYSLARHINSSPPIEKPA